MTDTIPDTSPETIEFPRAALDAMLRQAGIRGASAIPVLIAMRLGVEEMPPFLDTLVNAIDTRGAVLTMTMRVDLPNGTTPACVAVVVR